MTTPSPAGLRQGPTASIDEPPEGPTGWEAPGNPAAPVRVLVVGGEDLGSPGLAQALQHEPQLTVMAVDGDRADVPLVCSGQAVDVALLVDTGDPGRQSGSLIASIATASPATRICVLSAAPHEASLTYLGQGATGLLDDRTGPEVLTAALLAIHGGTWVLSAEVARFLVRVAGGSPRGQRQLTRREAEVLRLLAAGAPNRRIAEMLDVSEKTVRNYVSRVYHKLAIEDRSQLVRQAVGSPDPALRASTGASVR